MTRDCGCLDECEYVKYGVQVDHNIGYVFPSSKAVFQLSISLNCRASTTTSNMYFYSSFFYPFIKEEALRFSDFMGSFGGLIGLFAGASLISVIEVIYHVFDAIFNTIKSKMRRNILNPAWTVQKADVYVNREHMLYQFVRFLKKYFSRSDIHGLHYITDKGTRVFDRLFWTALTSTSIVCCSLLVFDTITFSELNPVEFSVDEKIWTSKDVNWEKPINFPILTCFYTRFHFR